MLNAPVFIDPDQLSSVTGGGPFRSALVAPNVAIPVGSALHLIGVPIRAIGRFAPNTVKFLADAAQMRHDIWTSSVHPGDQRAKAVHDEYVRAFYGPFAPK